jgi:hypothetical protein
VGYGFLSIPNFYGKSPFGTASYTPGQGYVTNDGQAFESFEQMSKHICKQSKAKLHKFCEDMHQAAPTLESIQFEYNGCGDSGWYEDYTFVTRPHDDPLSPQPDQKELEEKYVSLVKQFWPWKQPEHMERSDNSELMGDIFDTIDTFNDYDWVNNDGGQGTVILKIKECLLEWDQSINYSDSYDASFDRDLNDK